MLKSNWKDAVQALGFPLLVACFAIPYFFHYFLSITWVVAILAAIPTLGIIVLAIVLLSRAAFQGIEQKSKLESERFRQHMDDLADENSAPVAKPGARASNSTSQGTTTKRTKGAKMENAQSVQHSEPKSTKMPFYKRANEKQCVTCNRWQGERKITQFRDRAQYNDHQDKGECVGGDWDKTKTRAITSCSKWVKWGALS